MSPRLRWAAAVAAALCLHLPWWPRPATQGRPVVSAERPGRVTQVRVRAAVSGQVAPPVADRRGATGPPRRGAARAGGPPAAASAPTAAPFVPPADTVLDYHWTQGTRTRPVRLSWSTDAMAYRVTLETLPGTPGHAASWARSDGTWHRDTGLAPRRFTAKRPGQSEQAISFVHDPGSRPEAAFSATTFRIPLDDAAQDALSWLPHWLGWLPARGGAAVMQVAHPDGRRIALQFAQDPADPLHWEGTAPPDGDQIDLWLTPTPPHWPRRWRQTTPWGSVAEWSLAHQNEADESPPPP